MTFFFDNGVSSEGTEGFLSNMFKSKKTPKESTTDKLLKEYGTKAV